MSKGGTREWDEHYARLAEYAAVRRKELASMLRPYVDLTDDYGRLICRLVLFLGTRPPSSAQDSVVRDLLTDAFDFLYDSRELLLDGKCTQAYPLLRRAYETVSLFAVCVFDSEVAERWNSGEQITNHYLRKRLAAPPMNEDEEGLRDLYAFFCKAAHPNRYLIAQKFLGSGNQFVLGAIGPPDLVLVADYCRQHLSLWYWFAAAASAFYAEELKQDDPSYFPAYMGIAKHVQGMKANFVEQRARAREEYKEMCPERFGGTPN